MLFWSCLPPSLTPIVHVFDDKPRAVLSRVCGYLLHGVLLLLSLIRHLAAAAVAAAAAAVADATNRNSFPSPLPDVLSICGVIFRFGWYLWRPVLCLWSGDVIMKMVE